MARFIDFDEFVEKVKEADEAMQAALKVLPQEASELTLEVTTRTFREVRSTLVMAHGLQREEERKGR